MRVSVVIATYNRSKELSMCLSLIGRQEAGGCQVEVIIVDDGSTDGTEEMVGEIIKTNRLNLRYHRQRNLGPAAARNEGIRDAKGEIVVFVDDDSFPRDGWLESLLGPLLTGDKRIAGVRGDVISDLDDPASLSCALGKYIYASTKGTTATNNIAYRKEVLHEVGLFDERFRYAAGEDTDLGNRILDLGYRIVFSENAVVRHPHENSWETFRRKSITRGRGGAVYFKKWIFRKPIRGLTAFRPWKAWLYMPLLIFPKDGYSGFWKGAYILAYHKRYVLKGFLREML